MAVVIPSVARAALARGGQVEGPLPDSGLISSKGSFDSATRFASETHRSAQDDKE